MRLDLLNWPGALLFSLELLAVSLIIALPLIRPRLDDWGDGIAHVILPRPSPPPLPWRTFAFFGAFALLSLLYVGVLMPTFDATYGDLVARVASLALRQPANLAPGVADPNLGTRFIFLGVILCLPVAIRAEVARRALAAAIHASLYLALMTFLDAAILVAAVVFGTDFSPFSLVGNLIANAAGVVVFIRLLFTTFELPRPVELPALVRRGRETAVMLMALVPAATVALVAVQMLRVEALSSGLMPLLLSYMLPGTALTLTFAFLAVIRLFGQRSPAVGEDRPAIDVITPAYNEERRLTGHLAAIESAAAVYGGPVRVFVCDDGSTDRTAERAAEAMAQFRNATGELIQAPHRGKVDALNTAFERGAASIVVRVDADVEVEARSFTYAQRWFREPGVGMVGALNLPMEGSSWFHKMREFECLWAFGFTRLTNQLPDAIQCVPGTFAAFRRDLVDQFGGFVTGMNGEDADLTMMVGRAGYRVVLDSAVRVSEDVPATLSGFREQRIRWNRAGWHVFARHAFFRAGLAGPRTWFTQPRMTASRVLALARNLLIIHVVLLAMLVPSYRNFLILAVSLPILAQMVMLYFLAALAVGFNRMRHIHYLPTWVLFVILRRLFVLESILTLPARPVLAPRFWLRRPVPGVHAGAAAFTR